MNIHKQNGSGLLTKMINAHTWWAYSEPSKHVKTTSMHIEDTKMFSICIWGHYPVPKGGRPCLLRQVEHAYEAPAWKLSGTLNFEKAK